MIGAWDDSEQIEECRSAAFSRFVCWPRLAACLELPAAESALPVCLPCPLCRTETFWLDDDPSTGGFWFHCTHCDRHGDLVELAAACWDLSLSAAVHQLVRVGAWLPGTEPSEELIGRYLELYPDYRQRMQRLWEEARQLFRTGSPTVNRLRRHFGLLDDLSPERWQEGPGQLVGAHSCRAIEAAFHPHLEGETDHLPINTSAQRIFHGRGWDDVLVVPFEDLPRRTCGFFFVGRHGEPTDRAYRRLRLRWRQPQPQHAEAGLAGLPAIRDTRINGFGGTVFAVDDPMLLLRLQVQHYRTFFRPLPLVAWYDGLQGRTGGAWTSLQGRPVAFWAKELDARLLYQAVRSNGHIALGGPEEVSPGATSHYLRQLFPRELLFRIQRMARHWPAVLGEWMKDRPDGAVQELLRGLQARQLDLDDLFRPLPRRQRLRLQALECSPAPRTIRYGQRSIQERPDGWYEMPARPSGSYRRLTNFLLRIEKTATVDGALRYQGRVIFEGRDYPFEVSARRLERSPWNWLLQFFAGQVRAVPRLPASGGGLSLVKLALAFHEPDFRPKPPSRADPGVQVMGRPPKDEEEDWHESVCV